MTTTLSLCVDSSLEKEYKGKQSETLKKLHHFPQELIERSTHPLAVNILPSTVHL